MGRQAARDKMKSRDNSSILRALVLAVWVLCGPLSHARAAGDETAPVALDAALNQMAGTISEGMGRENGVSRLAVSEFTEPAGNVTLFGKYVAEELIGRMVQAHGPQIVERRILEKVLEEQKLGTTGLLDPAGVKRIGDVLGVQAILVGSISRLGGRTVLRARVLSVATAKVIAIASAEVSEGDAAMRSLMGMAPAPVGSGTGAGGKKGLFYEQNWNGADVENGDRATYGGVHYRVKQSTKGTTRYLAPENPDDEGRLTGWVNQWVEFPEDFIFEFTCNPTAHLHLELSDGGVLPVIAPEDYEHDILLDWDVYRTEDRDTKKWRHRRVEKKGEVMKLFEDGKFLSSVDFPRGVKVIGFAFLVERWSVAGDFKGYEP